VIVYVFIVYSYSRAEVLRCILFILIDAGIVPVRRYTRKMETRHALLLSIIVFVLNLPAAFLVLCYLLFPPVGYLATMYCKKDVVDLRFILAFHVCALLPFVILGSIAFSEDNVFQLSNIWITFLFFILPLMTITHIYCYKNLNCKYGIWSLPGSLWSFELNDELVIILHILTCPILVGQYLSAIVYMFLNIIPFAIITNGDDAKFNEIFVENNILFDIHVLAVEAITLSLLLLLFPYPWFIVLPVCFVSAFYFMSLSILDIELH